MAKKEISFDYKEAREELRKWLVKYTGCGVQEGINGKNYPCGTCFMALLDSLGLDGHNPEYEEHNKPVDRHNEVWRAVLQIRDAEL